MARPPKGKPLTLRPIRLDDDVWAECQRLGKEHGTINEGMRLKLLPKVSEIATVIPPCDEPCEHLSCEMQRLPSKPKTRSSKQIWKRGQREKGDKTR